METVFSQLPDDSRVWIFGAASDLTPQQQSRASELLEEFTASWNAHGAQVLGEYAILRARFIVVAASSEGAATSGCSIDDLVRTVRNGLESAGVVFADLSDIFFQDSDKGGSSSVCALNRSEFAELVAAGNINGSTIVFDPSIQLLGDFKQRWEQRFADSWHAKLFALPETAPAEAS